MGLFDFLKKKPIEKPSVPENEKKYYRPDNYYTEKAFEGTPFEKKVVTFEERKKSCIPSASGLYVAEILLLEYCSYGTYPHPKNGYPGFWWFEYGIRDVGSVLQSLEARGYIEYGSAMDRIPGMTVVQLKEIAEKFGLKVSGKKEDIISSIIANVPAEKLNSQICDRKYKLTKKGKIELQENQYIPYMHKNKLNDTEDTRFGPVLNVWEVNKKIACGISWEKAISDIEAAKKAYRGQHEERMRPIREELIRTNPEYAQLEKELAEQDAILEKRRKAEERYKLDNDIDSLLNFWRSVWNDGSCFKIKGSWLFNYPELLIKEKRYDEAWGALNRLYLEMPNCAGRVRSLQAKVLKAENKHLDEAVFCLMAETLLNLKGVPDPVSQYRNYSKNTFIKKASPIAKKAGFSQDELEYSAYLIECSVLRNDFSENNMRKSYEQFLSDRGK